MRESFNSSDRYELKASYLLNHHVHKLESGPVWMHRRFLEAHFLLNDFLFNQEVTTNHQNILDMTTLINYILQNYIMIN